MDEDGNCSGSSGGFLVLCLLRLACADSPFKLDDVNVVHMTVKPADFLDDDEGAGGKAGKGQSTRGQDGEERTAGCRCVIL